MNILYYGAGVLTVVVVASFLFLAYYVRREIREMREHQRLTHPQRNYHDDQAAQLAVLLMDIQTAQDRAIMAAKVSGVMNTEASQGPYEYKGDTPLGDREDSVK